MKSAVTIFAAFATMLLASCANRNSGMDHPVGTGPFDSRGNYIEAWADNPAKWRGGDRKPTPPRTTTPQPSRPPQVVASNPPPRQSAQTQPTAQTRPFAQTQPRPQVRPQPQVRRYTVKRGDTLSAIARRHNTTVAGIRRANGISGDLIRPGQVLRIP